MSVCTQSLEGRSGFWGGVPGVRRLQSAVAALLIFTLTLGCSGSKKDAKSHSMLDPDAVRYRLLLRENPVDSGEAFRCYGGCQSAKSPDGYMACLKECPGFELSVGMRCADHEIPPVAACVTARKVPVKDDMDPGLVVLYVIANVAVVVALSSVCASSSQTQCGYGYGY